MNSLIGFSVRGNTYYCLNTFSGEQMYNLKQFAKNYQNLNPMLYSEEDDAIINQFVLHANQSLNLHLCIISVDEIIIIK